MNVLIVILMNWAVCIVSHICFSYPAALFLWFWIFERKKKNRDYPLNILCIGWYNEKPVSSGVQLAHGLFQSTTPAVELTNGRSRGERKVKGLLTNWHKSRWTRVFMARHSERARQNVTLGETWSGKSISFSQGRQRFDFQEHIQDIFSWVSDKDGRGKNVGAWRTERGTASLLFKGFNCKRFISQCHTGRKKSLGLFHWKKNKRAGVGGVLLMKKIMKALAHQRTRLILLSDFQASHLMGLFATLRESGRGRS